ncbi:hypothetical protein J6590_061686 [Homalodisca vitripennis]|nr:hypothetical protein J6590_061686 [Homalodisca vitripennis]
MEIDAGALMVENYNCNHTTQQTRPLSVMTTVAPHPTITGTNLAQGRARKAKNITVSESAVQICTIGCSRSSIATIPFPGSVAYEGDKDKETDEELVIHRESPRPPAS